MPDFIIISLILFFFIGIPTVIDYSGRASATCLIMCLFLISWLVTSGYNLERSDKYEEYKTILIEDSVFIKKENELVNMNKEFGRNLEEGMTVRGYDFERLSCGILWLALDSTEYELIK